jgi:hypothetical protein
MLINRTFFKGSILAIAALFFLAGCSKKDRGLSSSADFQSFSINAPGDSTSMMPLRHRINVRVSDSVSQGLNLSSLFSLSPGAQAAVGSVSQVSGVTANNFETDVDYTITAADHATKEDWIVQATNNIYSIDWGLGHFVNSSVSHDKDYEWYLDQMNTGIYATVNCGPTAVTMAIKWADPSFTKTPVDARAVYEPAGGWWSTDDVDKYLTDNNIPHNIIPLSTQADATGQLMAHQLDNNQILMMCIDMNYVRSSGSADYRVDKFYATTPNWGHFYVVKGYKIVDHELMFEVYDPNSWGLTNNDQTLKGRNRFYRYEDVAASCRFWFNYAFVIAQKGQTVNPDAVQHAVDPSTIVHAKGF